MSYYDKNYKDFIERTSSCDLSQVYSFFEKHLSIKNPTILEIGFGSCRDMLRFKSLGFDVYGIDPTKGFCDYAVSLGFNHIEQLKAEDITYNKMFDAVWANASLIHVNKDDLNDTFKKCSNALKDKGIIYASFKYGDYEIEKEDRYFNYVNENTINEYLDGTNLKVIDVLITEDVRPDRPSEFWLNVVLEKE